MSWKFQIKYKVIIVLLALIVVNVSARQADTLIFNNQSELITKKLHFYRDATNSLTFENVANGNNFIPSVLGRLNFDHTDDVLWSKFTLLNNSQAHNLCMKFENPLIDSIDVFIEQNDGGYKKFSIYNSNFFDTRGFMSSVPCFLFELEPQKRLNVLLRIRSSEQLILPIRIEHFSDTINELKNRDIVFGLFIGIILVMFFYNFFIFLSTKDENYLYYVLYIFFVGIAQITLSGHFFEYIIPSFPATFKYSIVVLPAISCVFAVLFVRKFLHTPINAKKYDKILIVILYLYVIAAIMRLFGFYHISSIMMDIIGIPAAIFVFVVAVVAYRNGFNSAMYFILAWTIFLIGVLIFILSNLDVLPYTVITSYALPAGASLEVGLLSFALADKLNVLEKQKREKEQEVLKAAQENERIIKEQNVVLEQRVSERTFELNEAMTNLKETQSQLVSKEKMASLGQLTAGIAHEINNPINFVSSNVNPLKRDVAMLLDLFNNTEELVFSDKAVEQKREELGKFKDNIEFDYLKEEINFLLKGIGDGAFRTAEIVKGLRVFSRLDEDGIKKADIFEGIDSTLVIINNQLGKIKVNKSYEGINIVDCFPGKLNQVFLNLLTNAIHANKTKFADNEGGLINISVRTINSQIEIIFEDNGCGMSIDTLSRIYEPFFTTKPVGEGTGLGLSMVFKTIEQHNGTISVTSEEMIGTKFRILLPIDQTLDNNDK